MANQPSKARHQWNIEWSSWRRSSRSPWSERCPCGRWTRICRTGPRSTSTARDMGLLRSCALPWAERFALAQHNQQCEGGGSNSPASPIIVWATAVLVVAAVLRVNEVCKIHFLDSRYIPRGRNWSKESYHVEGLGSQYIDPPLHSSASSS